MRRRFAFIFRRRKTINYCGEPQRVKYLIQNAEYTGIYGISFWVVMINVLFYDLFYQRTVKKLYILLIFIFPWLMGYYLFNQVDKHIIENHKIKVSEYKNGKKKLLGFFIGLAMKECRGQANPKILNQIFLQKLESD